MELTLGQRLRQGSLGVWHMVSPYLDGLGIASVCVCILVCIYYNVILAWCLVYFVNSFKSPLPWSTCPKEKVMEGKFFFALFNFLSIPLRKLASYKLFVNLYNTIQVIFRLYFRASTRQYFVAGRLGTTLAGAAFPNSAELQDNRDQEP